MNREMKVNLHRDTGKNGFKFNYLYPEPVPRVPSSEEAWLLQLASSVSNLKERQNSCQKEAQEPATAHQRPCKP